MPDANGLPVDDEEVLVGGFVTRRENRVASQLEIACAEANVQLSFTVAQEDGFEVTRFEMIGDEETVMAIAKNIDSSL